MQSNNHRVTVVVPYFNGKVTIRRALLSVAKQKGVEIKVMIIVDTVSLEDDDFLGKLCVNLGISADIVHQRNSGQSSARNFGLELAQTDLVTFLDQDDEFLPDHCAILSRELEDAAADYVWADAVLGSNLETPNEKIGMRKAKLSRSQLSIEKVLTRGALCLPGALMVRRTAFPEHQLFNTELRGFEDDSLVLRLLQGDYSGKFLDMPVLVWHQGMHSSSYSSQFLVSRLKFWVEVEKIKSSRNINATVFFLSRMRFDFNHAIDTMTLERSDHQSNGAPEVALPKGYFISRAILSENDFVRLTFRIALVAMVRFLSASGCFDEQNKLRLLNFTANRRI